MSTTEMPKTKRPDMEKTKMPQKWYEQIITKNWANLTEYIIFDNISPMLIQKQVITPTEAEIIRGGPDMPNGRMMQEFLTILWKKRLNNIYDKFKDVLRHYECEKALEHLQQTENEGKITSYVHCLINATLT